MSRIPIAYDPAVIQEFAGRLYSQAASIIFTSTLFGVFVGTILAVGFVATVQNDEILGVAFLIGILIGGFFGYSRGKERAFKLKLEAQVALCQVKIEQNTNVARN